MQSRTLGSSGIAVSALGLGCWGMSGAYGPADEPEAIATLHRALDLGLTLIDTADSYGDGHNETLIGIHLASRRREFVLASKTGWVKRPTPSGGTEVGVDGRPDRLKGAVDASLTRLRTDVIDLYYLHRVDPDVPVEDSVGALSELVTAGKIRAIGLSEVSEPTLRRAHAVHPIAALQSEYSLWTREPEQTVMPVCESLGIAFVPFSPLGRGFLTGSVTTASDLAPGDWRVGNPRFQAENFARNLELLKPLQSIAAAHGATPAQVALAWVLSRGPQVIPIPGMKRRRHLESNLAAIDLPLTPGQLAHLDSTFAPDAIAGDRYTPEVARWAGR